MPDSFHGGASRPARSRPPWSRVRRGPDNELMAGDYSQRGRTESVGRQGRPGERPSWWREPTTGIAEGVTPSQPRGSRMPSQPVTVSLPGPHRTGAVPLPSMWSKTFPSPAFTRSLNWISSMKILSGPSPPMRWSSLWPPLRVSAPLPPSSGVRRGQCQLHGAPVRHPLAVVRRDRLRGSARGGLDERSRVGTAHLVLWEGWWSTTPPRPRVRRPLSQARDAPRMTTRSFMSGEPVMILVAVIR